jgi:hypothetical protein
LDAAGSHVGKLFGFDKLFNFDNLFDRGILSNDQEKVNFKSVEECAATAESHSASKKPNAVVSPGVVEPSFSAVKIYSPSEEAGVASNSAAQNTQNKNIRAGALTCELSASGQKKTDSKGFTENLTPRKLTSVPKRVDAKLDSRMVAPSSSAQRNPSVSENAKPLSSSQVRDSQSSNLQKEWEGTFFGGPTEDDVKKFGKRLTSSYCAGKDNPTWIYV